MEQSRRFTIELTVWPENADEDVYTDIVEALDDYLPYNKVYTIFPHEPEATDD